MVKQSGAEATRTGSGRQNGAQAKAQNFQTAQDIAARLHTADAEEFAVLERSLAADTRKTVRTALDAARRRLAADEAEAVRLDGLYEYEQRVCDGALCVGLDEVGRGPLAGPLAVGAVVLVLLVSPLRKLMHGVK